MKLEHLSREILRMIVEIVPEDTKIILMDTSRTFREVTQLIYYENIGAPTTISRNKHRSFLCPLFASASIENSQ